MDKTGRKAISRHIKTRIIIKFLLSAFALSGFCVPFMAAQAPGSVLSFGPGITAKKFYSSAVDRNNSVWFLTEAGIISYDGTKWNLHNANPGLASAGFRGLIISSSSRGQELWLASPGGAVITTLPVEAGSAVTTFSPVNSKILSENVLALAAGEKEIRWMGTPRGISVYKNDKWLTNSYDDRYPESVFEAYPITSMATSPDGDSLYIGSKGGGVMRVYRNEVDAVSGASEYAAWGPILMPSDSVYCVHISADGTQWFGTDKGLARHEGFRTLEGWKVITTNDGLAGDFVQAIGSDTNNHIFIGTNKGFSVFDGTRWTSFTTKDGLISNNILTIAVDRKGSVWLGTDNGVSLYRDGKFTSYR